MGKQYGWVGCIWIAFQISSKLREELERFCGYLRLLVDRVSAVSGARATSECPTKLTTFQDLGISPPGSVWVIRGRWVRKVNQLKNSQCLCKDHLQVNYWVKLLKLSSLVGKEMLTIIDFT